MRHENRWGYAAALLAAAGVTGAGTSAHAADFSNYATKGTYKLTFPPTPASEEGYFTLFGTFSSTTDVVIDNFALKGRLFAVDGHNVWIQKNYGSSVWMPIATVDVHMDPAFLKISPDGTTFALGTGFSQPLYLGATTLLSITSPPDLTTATGVRSVTASFYDADWRDNRYLFLDDISNTADPGSRIYAVDTSLADPSTDFITIIPLIPGASSGLAFDHNGNFVTGNGYTYVDPAVSATGEIKTWSAASIASALTGTPLAYETSGHLLASAILSAAPLGFDVDDNLYVGGGDAFGSSGHLGYAALVQSSVVTSVLAGGAPVDPSDPAQYVEVQPDPCHNDDSTYVHYVDSLKMLVVTADLASLPPNCAPIDTTGSNAPSTTNMQLYFPPDAPDTDGDGVPDGADNAYVTPNPDQTDADGDGYGDAADADFNNDGVVDELDFSDFVTAFEAATTDANYDPRGDFNADGKVDFTDFATFTQRWASQGPFY